MEPNIDHSKTKGAWFKTWWGILILILFWPFSLTYYLWSRKWNRAIKIVLIILLWVFTISVFSASSNSQSQQAFQEGYNSGKSSETQITASPKEAKVETALMAVSPNPSIPPMARIEPSPLPSPSTKSIPERKLVKGSTPKGISFYDKLDSLQKQGKINGVLCTEFESDPIVDVNPDTQSVQLSLMYQTLTTPVNNSTKTLVMNDFKIIKALAEQDKSLLLPDYGTLRLFVLTFHDDLCKGRGEVSQLMIDDKPEWIDWK